MSFLRKQESRKAMKQYFTYIITNRKRGVLYIGVTSNLIKRIYEHREGLVDGFSNKYNLKMLVYYEIHGSVEHAITREKQMKRWKRDWKIELIEKYNPDWNDLYKGLFV